MKLVVDVNLPPKWVELLATRGIEAVHWSQVGDLRATDSTIMKWARDGGYVVLTSDLDFSAMLATSGAAGPSVLQVRTQDVFPESLGAQVVRVLLEQSDALESGAIVTIDEIAARVRILPIRRQPASEGHD
jgi:predicted nuclease of predicted toxin-antitoxin system